MIFSQIGSNVFQRPAIFHPVKLPGIYHAPVTRKGFGHLPLIDVIVFRLDHHYDVQTIFSSKIEITLIMRRHGHDVSEVALVGDDGSELPAVLDVIAGGDISLIINTPMPRSGAVLDAAAIRHAAIAEGVLCMTTMDTAIAAAHSLEPSAQARIGEVRSLDAWLGTGPGR